MLTASGPRKLRGTTPGNSRWSYCRRHCSHNNKDYITLCACSDLIQIFTFHNRSDKKLHHFIILHNAYIKCTPSYINKLSNHKAIVYYPHHNCRKRITTGCSPFYYPHKAMLAWVLATALCLSQVGCSIKTDK